MRGSPARCRREVLCYPVTERSKLCWMSLQFLFCMQLVFFRACSLDYWFTNEQRLVRVILYYHSPARAHGIFLVLVDVVLQPKVKKETEQSKTITPFHGCCGSCWRNGFNSHQTRTRGRNCTVYSVLEAIVQTTTQSRDFKLGSQEARGRSRHTTFERPRPLAAKRDCVSTLQSTTLRDFILIDDDTLTPSCCLDRELFDLLQMGPKERKGYMVLVPQPCSVFAHDLERAGELGPDVVEPSNKHVDVAHETGAAEAGC